MTRHLAAPPELQPAPAANTAPADRRALDGQPQGDEATKPAVEVGYFASQLARVDAIESQRAKERARQRRAARGPTTREPAHTSSREAHEPEARAATAETGISAVSHEELVALATQAIRAAAEMPSPRLALSPAEAARALGVSRDFYDLHIAPELRVIRRGRRRLVDVRELQRWLEASGSRPLGGS